MCKRYFFILFVLKICTFRFANYTYFGRKFLEGIQAIEYFQRFENPWIIRYGG